MAKSNSEIARTKINNKTINKLWGISAGRCEMCNRLLCTDPTFGTAGNFAENAHICGVGASGPRHTQSLSIKEINGIENLMLLCSACHKMIDSNPDSYQESFLLNRKRGHEERVRQVTDISAEQTCRIVTYFTDVDNQKISFHEHLFKEALLSSQRVPLQYAPIELHHNTDTSYIATKEAFEIKAEALVRNYNNMRGTIHDKEAIAVFAFAPQPLLIKFGSLINDQHNAIVFQCHREGHKWAWKERTDVAGYVVKKTCNSGTNSVAVVIDLSAPVADDRVTAVLGSDITIYHLTMENPNRTFVTHPDVQERFVEAFRRLMEDIKNLRPRPDEIHLFPVMPISLAVRLGMDYMPKTDLPLILYEQASGNSGFFETLTLGGKTL